MPTEPFFIKQHDLQSYYPAQVKDSDGNAVDISGATIRTTMKNADTGNLKINRSTSGFNITSASNGDFEYQWQGSDTDTVGKFYIEFEITPGSGGKFTLPNNPDERAEVWVMPSLDTS